MLKFGEYLNAGVDEVRIVDPEERWVERHRPDTPSRRLHEGDVLREVAVLPGFDCDVSAIFSED